MLNQIIGRNVIYISKTESTNSFVKEQQGSLPNGTCVFAGEQTAGRGQQHTRWNSEKSKNITASVKLVPEKMEAEQQFKLNMSVSLGILDYLQEQHGIQGRIKWPNDILVDGRKICGILIENTLSGSQVQSSVIGFGMNINQTDFGDNLPNATSLALVCGRTFDVKEELRLLLECLDIRYRQLLVVPTKVLEEQYLRNVYGFDTLVEMRAEGGSFHAKITGIDTWGRLKTEKPDGTSGLYDIKQVQFVL
ncbi:MAG: biotin--[acetyl-CoA-carboxylase] ligase [Flavobacteriales bacterium]